MNIITTELQYQSTFFIIPQVTTQKPVASLEYLIKTYSNEGDTILDNTMGSGSTGVACEKTKRNFIGIELNDGYFVIAEKRIKEARQQLTFDFQNGSK